MKQNFQATVSLYLLCATATGVFFSFDAGADGGPLADGGTLTVSDAGTPADAGLPDSGMFDGGALFMDAGSSADGGMEPIDGTDAGALDAGGLDAGAPVQEICSPQCNGSTLSFCDQLTGNEAELDCAELEGTCGELSADWGDDCLLPEGAICDPGYAAGLSRCAAPLCCDGETYLCTDGECADEGNPPVPANAGGVGSATGLNDHPLSCVGCQGDWPPELFGGLVFLYVGRLRRIRKRAMGLDE